MNQTQAEVYLRNMTENYAFQAMCTQFFVKPAKFAGMFKHTVENLWNVEVMSSGVGVYVLVNNTRSKTPPFVYLHSLAAPEYNSSMIFFRSNHIAEIADAGEYYVDREGEEVTIRPKTQNTSLH